MVVGPLLPSSEFPEARAAAEAQAVRMARSVREAGDRAVIAPRADPDDDAVAGHESDRVLMDELPPFHRLPALLESVRDADAATAFRAWDALQKFTAADLIECDQYPQLLPALGALLATALRRTATDDIDAARAVAVERDCMRLHVRLLDEGGAAQRAEVLIALCARTRQPAVTLSSGVQETAHEEVGENESSAAYCSLLSRARLQVLRAPDGALLHAPLRDTLLGELFALSAADTAGVRRGLRWLIRRRDGSRRSSAARRGGPPRGAMRTLRVSSSAARSRAAHRRRRRKSTLMTSAAVHCCCEKRSSPTAKERPLRLRGPKQRSLISSLLLDPTSPSGFLTLATTWRACSHRRAMLSARRLTCSPPRPPPRLCGRPPPSPPLSTPSCARSDSQRGCSCPQCGPLQQAARGVCCCSLATRLRHRSSES